METAEAQELPLTHFTSDSEIHPLPSALVSQVYQDRMGFIWFANYSSGVVRHDGIKMDLYDEKDGLKDLGVWQVQEDGAGHLWVSTDSGLFVSEHPLDYYKNGKRIRFSNSVNGVLLYDKAITHNQGMTAGSNGRIYVGTDSNGVLSYNFDKNQELKIDSLSTSIGGKINLRVTAIAKGDGDRILLGLEDGRLALLNENELQPFYEQEKFAAQENFVSLYEDEVGKIWAFNQDGRLWMFRSFKERPTLVYSGKPSTISAITSIKGGKIFASNGESGIVRVDSETGKSLGEYTRKNGLLSSNVYDVLEDREGNIWIAQSGGLSKIRYNFRAFENYSPQVIPGGKPVLPSGRINGIMVPKNSLVPGRFWTGSEAGLSVVNSEGQSETLTERDGLLVNWVNAIAEDDKGRVWIATVRGLNVLAFEKKELPENSEDPISVMIFNQPGVLVRIKDSPPSIAAEELLLKAEEKKQKVKSSWFPGKEGLFGVVGDRTYSFGPQQGLPKDLYISVVIDDNDFMWVGTRESGLYKSREKISVESLSSAGKLQKKVIFEPAWNTNSGAPVNRIEKLLSWNGLLLLGTKMGLIFLDPETMEIKNILDNSNSLPNDSAISFALSPVSGNLWVGTNGGLAEVDLEKQEVIRTVNRHDGLLSDEVWLYGSVKVGPDGEVYFGTSDGVSIYYPDKDTPNEVPPKLYLTNADVSYKSDSRNEVALEYVGLSYANVPEVKYRTRLLNYENNWSAPTTERKLRYTNLPAYLWPKDYTLEVTAENGSGVYTPEPLRYTFSVKPVWWLQWYSFLLYLLLFSATVFVVDRLQRRKLIKRERNRSQLREAQLEAETATARSNAAEAEAKALKAENDKKEVELQRARQLEEAYEELKTAQNQVVQAEKMASLGRLATGIAHEIKNPLNFINNFAELSAELVDELEEMRRNGKENEIEAIMKDLKQNTLKIEEHGKRADAIVRSMMQHARGGKSSFEELDINSLVEKYSALAYHGKRAQNPAFFAHLHLNLSQDLARVKVMGQEIGQVLLNIIGNSLDAVWEKKQQLGDQFQPEVEILTRQNAESVEIVVTDNGPGVPEAIRERIFEPFFTTKPTGEGTGLGLSLSYNIITQGHNGSLSLQGNREGGATFIISLPAKRIQSTPSIAAREES